MKKRVISFILFLTMAFALIPVWGIVAYADEVEGLGLSYELNEDKKSYKVTGIGTFSGRELTIPASYKGLPVTVIGERAFEYVKTLTKVTVPSSVTTVEKLAFYSCDSLDEVYLPQSVTYLGDGAFSFCDTLNVAVLPTEVDYFGTVMFYCCEALSLSNITLPVNLTSIPDGTFFKCWGGDITIPSGVTYIGDSAFYNCRILEIEIPNGVTEIGPNAFWNGALTEICLPDSLEIIGQQAFSKNNIMKTVRLPKGIKEIGERAFNNCTALEEILYDGSCVDLLNNVQVGKDNDILWKKLVFADGTGENPDSDLIDGFEIYSSDETISARQGQSLELGVSINYLGHAITNTSGITFTVDDESIVKVAYISTINDLYYGVKLNALSPGSTFVNFYDSLTGASVRIPVTVYQDHLLSFTIENIPTQNIEKYESNFYNVNGMFIDSYKYTLDSFGGAKISFDVYNTNYIYSFVEIYNEEGNLIDACVIDKMKNNATSIKGSVWDNLLNLGRDIIDGDLLTYRQESGFSKHTHIETYVPKGGYLAITNDTMCSPLASLINGFDLMMQITSLYGSVKNYDPDDLGFKDTLTKKVIANAILKESIKEGGDFAKNLNKDVAKKVTISNVSLGNFANTFSSNVANLDIDELLLSACKDMGVNVAENVFIFLSGPIGKVLSSCFTGIKFGNTTAQFADYMAYSDSGAIYISNPSSDLRKVSGVTIDTGSTLSPNTSIDVYPTDTSTATLKTIKERNPEIYEKMRKGSYQSYNITMVEDGKEVQPQGEVTVYIPISPKHLPLKDPSKLKVYRLEENGDLTDMNARVEGDMLVFTTDHFSVYNLVSNDESDVQPVCDPLDFTYVNAGNNEISIRKYTGNDKHVIIPSTIDGHRVKSLGSYVFKDCEFLESVVIPSSIQTVYDLTFENCPNLKEITIDNNTDGFSHRALSKCPSFTTINYQGTTEEFSLVRGLPSSKEFDGITVNCTNGEIIGEYNGGSSGSDESDGSDTEDEELDDSFDSFEGGSGSSSSTNKKAEKKSLAWLWITLSFVVLGGIILFYFLYVKKLRNIKK